MITSNVALYVINAVTGDVTSMQYIFFTLPDGAANISTRSECRHWRTLPCSLPDSSLGKHFLHRRCTSHADSQWADESRHPCDRPITFPGAHESTS